MSYLIRTFNPSYGPQGQPYTLVIGTAAGEVRKSYWTLAEALEARDLAFDAGHAAVRVLGLPTTVSGT